MKDVAKTVPQWEELFKPLSDNGWGIREPQKKVGQLVIDTIWNGGVSFGQAGTGVGKSFASILPILYAINDKKISRAVISTENISLQNQYIEKDIPFLIKACGIDISYKKLMGRNNYLCMSKLSSASVASIELDTLYRKIQGRSSSVIDGDRAEIEDIVGYKIDDETWASISGSSEYCSEYCDAESCFGTRARQIAAKSQLVVTNHSMLVAHEQVLGMSSSEEASGILGSYDVLIVDEGHSLEDVMISGYTDDISYWSFKDDVNKLSKAFDNVRSYSSSCPEVDVDKLAVDFGKILSGISNFFGIIYGGEKWEFMSNPLCTKFVMSSDTYSEEYMDFYENTIPAMLTIMRNDVLSVGKYLKSIQKDEELIKSLTKKAKREVGTGITRAMKLFKVLSIIEAAISTDDGIVNDFGMKGVNVYGYIDNKGRKKVRIVAEPLDVSAKAKNVLNADSVCILSATLADPTDGMSFRYVARSLGFNDRNDIRSVIVDSPFDKKSNQLFYLTSGEYPKYSGTQFSHDEAISLIKKSGGRTLVLFTSKTDLTNFYNSLMFEKKRGNFPYEVFVQEDGADKKVLAEMFKENKKSVLLGSSSFMTGFDASGDTLTQVIIPKYTNPIFDSLAKQRIDYWRNNGFPHWYQRQGLMTFLQSVGRLLRSEKCYGVVSILDSRVRSKSSLVYKSVDLGIKATGSPRTYDESEVESFYAKY